VSKNKVPPKFRGNVQEEQRSLQRKLLKKRKLNMSTNNPVVIDPMDKLSSISPNHGGQRLRHGQTGPQQKSQINMTTVNLEFPTATILNLNIKSNIMNEEFF
jgi:hypothetical protein